MVAFTIVSIKTQLFKILYLLLIPLVNTILATIATMVGIIPIQQGHLSHGQRHSSFSDGYQQVVS